MLFFLNRTYTSDNWNATMDSTDKTLYLDSTQFSDSIDKIVFQHDIDFSSVSVSIQSYNLRYSSTVTGSQNDNILAIRAGIVSSSLISVNSNTISIKPYLALVSSDPARYFISNYSALLSLSIVAQSL